MQKLFFLLWWFMPNLINAVSLFPADHPTCLDASEAFSVGCDEDANFYVDQNGNCGCVLKQNVTSADLCFADAIACNEGEIFSQLYQYRNNTGMMEILHAGCGCYALSDDVNGSTLTAPVKIPAQTNEHVLVAVPCSISALSAAITTANIATSGILMLEPDCNYSIQTPAGASEGLPIITGNITIIGAKNTIISRDICAADFRIFTVDSGGRLTLRYLSIQNGFTAGMGGGILANGNLVLDQITMLNNKASNGGAFAVSAGAEATVVNSLFLTNATTSVGGGAFINIGTVTVTNSRFWQNTAPINGGAINTQAAGITTIIDSDFSKNTSGGLGGAISNLGVLTLTSSQIQFNTGSSGAGIATGNENVTLVVTRVANNTPTNCSPVNTIPGCVN